MTLTLENPTPDFLAWRRSVATAFPPLDMTVRGAGPFDGRSRMHRVAGVVVGDLAAGAAHSVWRSAGTIGAERLRLCKVSFQLAGRTVVTQHGVRRVLRPGDIAVYDVDAPYTVDNDGGFRSLVLMAPRRLLGLDDDRAGGAIGLRLSDRDGLGRLAGPMLRELADTPDLLDGSSARRAVRLITDLLAATVDERWRAERPQSPLERTQDWIEAHLADPDLSPGTVAAAQFMSSRRLHELFHAEATTVSSWVRARRLERCRHDLEDPAAVDVPVAVIGRRWGFTDPAHFSRTFRARFGSSPREHRARHSGESAGPAPG